MIRSISSMSATMPARIASSRVAHLDAEAQPRERRAQVVRDAGQQQRAIALDLRAGCAIIALKPRLTAAISDGPVSGSGGGVSPRPTRSTAPSSSRSGRAR